MTASADCRRQEVDRSMFGMCSGISLLLFTGHAEVRALIVCANDDARVVPGLHNGCAFTLLAKVAAARPDGQASQHQVGTFEPLRPQEQSVFSDHLICRLWHVRFRTHNVGVVGGWDERGAVASDSTRGRHAWR
jgi:hypothetical protein